MKVILYGNSEEISSLKEKVDISLDELGLSSLIEIEQTEDENLAQELSISKRPAFIIEEDSIDFRDMIFEGIVPETEEIKNMFMSIIGGTGSQGGSCGTGGGCGSGCSC